MLCVTCSSYGERALLGLSPGEPQRRRPVSVQHLKDLDACGADAHLDSCLRSFLWQNAVEVDAVLSQPLTHLQHPDKHRSHHIPLSIISFPIPNHPFPSRHITSHPISSGHVALHRVTPRLVGSHFISSGHTLFSSHFTTSHTITSYLIKSHHISFHPIKSHSISSNFITSHHIKIPYHLLKSHILSNHTPSRNVIPALKLKTTNNGI